MMKTFIQIVRLLAQVHVRNIADNDLKLQAIGLLLR